MLCSGIYIILKVIIITLFVWQYLSHNYYFFDVNYKEEIILGDNTLIIVKKGMCCRRKVKLSKKWVIKKSFYSLMTKRRIIGKHRIRLITFNIFELFFIFKNGHRENIIWLRAIKNIY